MRPLEFLHLAYIRKKTVFSKPEPFESRRYLEGPECKRREPLTYRCELSRC